MPHTITNYIMDQKEYKASVLQSDHAPVTFVVFNE